MYQFLALLADIANGVFAVALSAFITGQEVVWWHFLIGIPLAMYPDLDAIPELLKRGKLAASSEHVEDHREGLHFPILFLLAGLWGVFVFGYWGLVFLLATVLHFINDLYGTGWGIPLLWPLTHRRYKVLGRRVNRLKSLLKQDGDWDNVSSDERRLRWVVSWSKEELGSYIQRWGEENWIERWYLSLNWISFLEYTLFGLSLAITWFLLT